LLRGIGRRRVRAAIRAAWRHDTLSGSDFPETRSMSLTSTQIRYLRGLAHSLKPVIMTGNKGLTDAVIKELAIALDHHELVKVKLGSEDRDERRAQIASLSERAGAELVQSIGRVACFYRKNPDQPKLALPK
jgi:RNA-binding protein